MPENRKFNPDGFKYYITCKNKNGQKYYSYDKAPTWEYPDGRIEDTTNYSEIINKFKDDVENAMESNAEVTMQTGPQAEIVNVDPNELDLSTVVIENYKSNRRFEYFEN
ncbi:hypothetical protein [Halobacillus halophilus]|uniref:hypothetical protein n=1 Tax=Halobacillus halophilus TaxID=1570 RepID=UPI001CD6CC8C|nr:hypothetical protein [Halobacillus halophilus]MCA1011464.1 hypothetical protein [Halobacillus halophilus]